MDLAPTVGLGNAGMLQLRIQANLLAEDRLAEAAPVRVFAHHSQMTPAFLGKSFDAGVPGPRVYLGEEGRRDDDLALAGPPLPRDRSANALSAVCGVMLVRALLGESLRTAAPGPDGLPGGFPVRVEAGRVALDLPPGVDLREAIDFQWRSARLDGVERMERDGTVHFTAEAQEAVRALSPALTEPLSPAALEPRLRLLLGVLGLNAP
jgi:hypothetical protein